MNPFSQLHWRTPLPEVMARVFAERSTSNVWRWAEENVVLTALESPGAAGLYRSDRSPHTRFFQECYTDPEIREVIVKKGSQGGFTEAILNCIRWSVANDPVNILYAIDSRDEMRRVFRTRLIPSLQRMPATRARLSEDPDDTASLTVYMPDMWIMGAGGHASGALANKACQVCILDEADKHAEMAGDEGSTADLMRERFKTIRNSKLLMISKPVLDDGPITREFLTGTQHKFFLPCPHCGQFEEWVQERVIYSHCRDHHGDHDEERILREAFYECGHCSRAITDAQRRLIIPRGEWRQTNFRNLTPGKISLEFTDLGSLFPQATLGHIALDMLHAQRSPAKMRQVQANRFARAFKQHASEVQPAAVLKLRGDYGRGTLPWVPDMLVCAADVQEGCVKYCIVGFRWPGEMAVVDWGLTMRLADLHEVAAGTVAVHGTQERAPFTLGIIDEGHRHKEVRDFVLESEGHGVPFFASKGRGGQQTHTMRSIVGESRTYHAERELIVYHFADEAFKYELYIQRINSADKIRSGALKVPPLHLPAIVDQDFVAEVTAERLKSKKSATGFAKLEWVKEGEANDWGDCLKISLVAWHVCAAQYAPAAEQPAAA